MFGCTLNTGELESFDELAQDEKDVNFKPSSNKLNRFFIKILSREYLSSGENLAG